MAQIVKSDGLAPGTFQNDLEPLAHIAGVDGLVRLDPRWEHQVREDALFVLRQHLQHSGRQDDGAVGRLGLGFTDDQFSAHRTDLPVDTERSRGEVQIIPPEGQQLAPAHPGSQVQQEELVHPLRLGLNEEPAHLLPGQHLHLLPFDGREPAPCSGVSVDQFLLHRLVQGHLADGVTAAHRAVRHALSSFVRIAFSAALLHGPEELLEIRLGQPVELDIAQTGDQVVVDPTLVAQLGGGPEPGLGEILVPVIHPRPEGHIRPHLSWAVAAALLLQLFQLPHAFLLGLGQHIFCLRVTRLVIAYYYSALPAAILPQADGALAPFSLSCHAFTSP